MSHKVHTATQMTDEQVALRMLKDKGLAGKVEGKKIAVSGPGLRSHVPTVIDLSSGRVEGDGDNQKLYDSFPMAYAIAVVRVQAESEGATISNERVLDDGTVYFEKTRYLADARRATLPRPQSARLLIRGAGALPFPLPPSRCRTRPETPMTSKFPNTIKAHLTSLTRAMYVVTQEEDVTIRRIAEEVEAAGVADTTFVYNSAHGLLKLKDYIKEWAAPTENTQKETVNPVQMLSVLHKASIDTRVPVPHVYILTDAERLLSPVPGMADPLVLRKIKNILYQMNQNPQAIKNLIFLGHRVVIPEALRSYIAVIEDRLPSTEEITAMVTTACNRIQVTPPAEPGKLMAGLTSYQIKTALQRQVAVTDKEHPAFVTEIVHEMRRESIRQAGGLVTILPPGKHTFADMGGADRFKAWAERTKACWTPEGQAFGLRPPRGLLAMGMWGSGKSLGIQALATEWEMPLVVFEMGKLRGGLVGDSENNLYRVLATIEKLGPSLLWVDEAEKGLAGAGSSNTTDGGIGLRMLGILSTWMQETEAPCMLALTANRVAALPPEFVNRMDVAFFFERPRGQALIDILRIHVNKTKNREESYDWQRLAAASKDLVGREIEQCVAEAYKRSFFAEMTVLGEDILVDVLANKPRLVVAMAEQVKEVETWVGYDAERDEGTRALLATGRKVGGETQMKVVG